MQMCILWDLARGLATRKHTTPCGHRRPGFPLAAGPEAKSAVHQREPILTAMEWSWLLPLVASAVL